MNEGHFDLSKKFFTQALQNDPDYVDCQRAFKKVKRTDTLKKEAGEYFKAGEFENAIKSYTE